MHDWHSLSHVRWECKYHVVIVPKYRRRSLYGKFRSDVTLERMDEELAYLKSLPERIEEMGREDVSKVKQIELLMQCVDSIMKNIDRRAKYMDSMQYKVEFEAIDMMFRQMYQILREEIPDDDTLRRIGLKFSKLRMNNMPGGR